MTYQEILNNARTCMGPYCKSCPTCNGMACKNTIPGPGAKGIGTGFIRNYQKWQELCVNMDTICENKPVDTSYDFFGKKVVLPVFAAPVGAMQLHYGDKYDDLTYNDILVTACAAAGIAAFTGDGINPAVMEGAAEALKKNSGCGVPTVKPWNMALVEEKMALAKAADPIAIAMDIDAAGLPLLGVIPEDPDVPYCLNRGLVLREQNYYAARAYENIAKRIMGQKTPLMKI
jgi:4-hydroxymandelate oxidase